MGVSSYHGVMCGEYAVRKLFAVYIHSECQTDSFWNELQAVIDLCT